MECAGAPRHSSVGYVPPWPTSVACARVDLVRGAWKRLVKEKLEEHGIRYAIVMICTGDKFHTTLGVHQHRFTVCGTCNYLHT